MNVLVDDVVHTVPLVSGALWAFVGVATFARYSTSSPFSRALTLFTLLIAAGCLADWYLLTFVNPADTTWAVGLANLRTSIVAMASLVILLAAKWISRGHSKYDGLLTIPIAIAIVLVWSGMTTGVTRAPGGEPIFGRDPVRFGVFVAIEVAYFLAATFYALSLVIGRTDLPPRLRRPALLSVSALVAFVILYLVTNVTAALTQAQSPPLFSSTLVVPALMVMVAFGRRTPEEMGEIFRAVSEVERRVIGLYVFYRTGEPLVAVGASRTLPIEAEQLQAILDLVGNFVETSMRKFRGYATTSMHFDRLGILAVRGEFVIVATVFEGAAYDALRSEISRSLQAFEKAHRGELQSWEGASGIADAIADDLAALVRRPTSQAPAKQRPAA